MGMKILMSRVGSLALYDISLMETSQLGPKYEDLDSSKFEMRDQGSGSDVMLALREQKIKCGAMKKGSSCLRRRGSCLWRRLHVRTWKDLF